MGAIEVFAITADLLQAGLFLCGVLAGIVIGHLLAGAV
jgi:hypothetical protein